MVGAAGKLAAAAGQAQRGPQFRNGFTDALLTDDGRVIAGVRADGSRFAGGVWTSAPAVVRAASLGAAVDPDVAEGWVSIGQSNGAGAGGELIPPPFNRPVDGAWMLGLAAHAVKTRATPNLDIVRAPDVRGGVNRSNIHLAEPMLRADFNHLVPARARQYGRGKQGLSPDLAAARHYRSRLKDLTGALRPVILVNCCVGGALWQSLCDPARTVFGPGERYMEPDSPSWPAGRTLVDDIADSVTAARDLARAQLGLPFRVLVLHADQHEANDREVGWAAGFAQYLDDVTARVMAITGQTAPPVILNKQGASFYDGQHMAALGCLKLMEQGKLVINAPDLSYADLWRQEDFQHRNAAGHIANGAFSAEAALAITGGGAWSPPRPLPDDRAPVRRNGRQLLAPLLGGPVEELDQKAAGGPFYAPDLSAFGGLKSLRAQAAQGAWLPLAQVRLIADGETGTALLVDLADEPDGPVTLHHATYGQSIPRSAARIVATPFAGRSHGDDCLGRPLRAGLCVFAKRSDR